MSHPGPGSAQGREDAARRLPARLRLRPNEAVGILQVWHACHREQARDDLDVTAATARYLRTSGDHCAESFRRAHRRARADSLPHCPRPRQAYTTRPLRRVC